MSYNIRQSNFFRNTWSKNAWRVPGETPGSIPAKLMKECWKNELLLEVTSGGIPRETFWEPLIEFVKEFNRKSLLKNTS